MYFSFLIITSVVSKKALEEIDIPDLVGDTTIGSGKLSSYHSSEKIQEYIQKLAESGVCDDGVNYNVNTMSKTSDSGSTADIGYVDISSKTPATKVKSFLLFGEHARELISPESALYFINYLCKKPPSETGLDKVTYRIVYNGNPISRIKVEQGDYCVRLNPNNVDLNRNWDIEWQANAPMSDTNPGPKPFSEPETLVFKQLAEEFQPNLFLTVHSGTKGMYLPYAYKQDSMETIVQSDSKSKHMIDMLEMVRPLDAEYCQCPYGGAGEEVQYECPGTCLDYVFEKIPSCAHAFAFEIYTSRGAWPDLANRFKAANTLYDTLLENHKNGGEHQSAQHLIQSFQKIFHNHVSDFLQVKKDDKTSSKERNGKQSLLQQDDDKRSLLETDSTAESTFDCFTTFNPESDDYLDTVKTWSRVYRDLSIHSHEVLLEENLLTTL